MYRVNSVILFLLLFSVLHAQQPEDFQLDGTIEWTNASDRVATEGGIQYFPLSFENAEYEGEPMRYPVIFIRIPIEGPASARVFIEPVSSSYTELPSPAWKNQLPTDITPSCRVSRDRDRYAAIVKFAPLWVEGEKVKLLESFRIRLVTTRTPDHQKRNREYTLFSALMEGTIFRLPINQTGMHRIDYNYLAGLGIDMKEIDPLRIQLFGNGGGPLPESLNSPRIDDLAENPILVTGSEDGSFDPGDLILFYAEGPDSWEYDEVRGRYEFNKNVYDAHNYYFLRIDGEEEGLRVGPTQMFTEAEYISQHSDYPQVYENDKTNLLAQYDHTEGTGQKWYGESFFSTKEQDFASKFDLSSLIVGEILQYQMLFAARNASASSLSFTIGERSFNRTINGVSVQSPEATYARDGEIEGSFILESIPAKLIVKTNAYQGWLDKIVLNGRIPLSYSNKPLVIQDRFSLNRDKAGFEVSKTPSDLHIWDVTDPVNARTVPFSSAGNDGIRFFYQPDRLRQFIAFQPADISLVPGKGILIENQNLHGITDAEMIIVYHRNFREQAERLADHRSFHNGLEAETVDIAQIYHEFSSGRQDPTALRDFVKMVYDRNPGLKYLLLFGDGSYDYKSILNPTNNDQFIPVYETMESLNPISGYVSDDFYALLSDDEGYDLEGDLDIAVGRLPVRTAAQAKILVDKIIAYELSTENDGDWQNRIALIADDEDASRHLDQTETVARYLRQNHPVFNLEKIYLDAFKQEVNPGGHRYPEANKSINDNMYKGVLAMTYIGHGGPGGFAQERVLRLEDIYSWNNDPRLPLLITATCSFAGFDDPAINTAGEASILKENGGVISLFSTVRLVYSNENSILINAVFNEIFTKYDGNYLKLGEVLRVAKNKIGNKDNKRKFFLFGDPAMQLALPEYKVYTRAINGRETGQGSYPDTLRALSKVRIDGYIGDVDGQVMSDFNGIVYPTLFDKVRQIETLSNDSGSPVRSFEVQKQILFKGAATVKNGEFSFEFILPKDIDYRLGEGKLSYYYSNGDNRDANGYFTGFIIGGSSDDVLTDNEGPAISLYLNHTEFVSGDVTNARPVLLAHLSDASGINISGTSIGHDLKAVLDGQLANGYRLNDFFQSATDDYTSGEVSFPLDRLEPGEHTLYLEAWDILNNKGEATIDFIVADEEEQVLTRLFNYPNPVIDHTSFYFEHTLPDSELDVRITIFDLSGRLVKTIDALAFTDGYRINHIDWDGTGDGNNPLPDGVYVYHIRVISASLGLTVESDFEKLVLIN